MLPRHMLQLHQRFTLLCLQTAVARNAVAMKIHLNNSFCYANVHFFADQVVWNGIFVPIVTHEIVVRHLSGRPDSGFKRCNRQRQHIRLFFLKISAAARAGHRLGLKEVPSILVELHHAKRPRIFNPVAEYRCTVLLLCALTQNLSQRVAVKNVITEHKTYRVVTHELASNKQRVRDTTSNRLFCVADMNAELTSVAEQRAECIRLVRRNDYHDIGNARLHKNCKRVVNHGLVVNRKQRLAHRFCHRVKARAFAGG